MAFKFVHAADLHLDSPMRGLERYDGAPVEALRQATRQALTNLVNLCRDERVQFLLIAGDIYDGDWRDYNTGLFFAAQMSRLREANIPVYIVRGNHDAISQISRTLKLPENVHVFASRPETMRLEALGVAVHGQSFHDRVVDRDLSGDYPEPMPGCFNIGLLHTSADGREGHEVYAPCSVTALRAKGYHYWALGHVHQQEIVCRDPWIVFPGNIQGRHARETGAKGCVLVQVNDHFASEVNWHWLDTARWAREEIDLTGADSLSAVYAIVERALQQAAGAADSRLLALRLILRGRCPIHTPLVSAHEQLLNECRAMASDIAPGQIWLEKVICATTEAATDQPPAADAMLLAGLIKYCRRLRDDETALNELLGEFVELQRKLPLELRQGAEGLDLQKIETLRPLLPETEALLISRLRQAADVL